MQRRTSHINLSTSQKKMFLYFTPFYSFDKDQDVNEEHPFIYLFIFRKHLKEHAKSTDI